MTLYEVPAMRGDECQWWSDQAIEWQKAVAPKP